MSDTQNRMKEIVAEWKAGIISDQEGMISIAALAPAAVEVAQPAADEPVPAGQVPKGWQLVARGAEVQWTDPQGRTGRVWDQNGELKNERAFARLVRSLLSAAPAATTQQVPEGWMLSTADFSVIASGGRTPGRVMLIRDPAGKRAWLGLPEEVRDSEDGPPLFVTGYGATFQEALSDAAKAAALAPSLTSYEMNREEGLR